jgi:hypothetical protein
MVMSYRIALLIVAVIVVVSGTAKLDNLANQAYERSIAERFEVNRRITFINGVTNQTMMVIEGHCYMGGVHRGRTSVICQVAHNERKSYSLGLGSNVSFVTEQIDAAPNNLFQPNITFNPTIVIPDIQVNTGG